MFSFLVEVFGILSALFLFSVIVAVIWERLDEGSYMRPRA